MKRSYTDCSIAAEQDSVCLVSCKAPRLSIPGMLDVNMLRTHAGVATNLGRLLYMEGDYVTAMCLYQESLQSLLSLEAATDNEKNQSVGISTTSEERHKELVHLLSILSSKAQRRETRKTYCEAVRKLFIVEEKHCSALDEEGNSGCTVGGFPGLLKRNYAKLRGAELLYLTGLTFAEPFRVELEGETLPLDLEEKHFIIPCQECSKAIMFNMGLIHYHWGCVDKAMKFFDLASSICQQLSPLSFDPIILASFNNMAQIHFQYGRTDLAMELLQDALTRGKAALTALYGEQGDEWSRCSRRLRRKLARTAMNICHVQYINCEYDAAMETCHEAQSLLLPERTMELEVASICHNIGVLLYHQGKKHEAIQQLEKFIKHATQVVGPDHLQLAEAFELLGKALYEAGQWHECMAHYNEALRIRQLKLEADHPSVAESLCAMGRVWLAREEYDFSSNAFTQGMTIHRAAAGTDGLSFEAAQTLLDLGRTFHAQKRTEEALECYQEAHEWTARFFGVRSAFVARLLNILGNLNLELGRVEDAMQLFSEETKICSELQLPANCTVVKDPSYNVRHSVPSAAAIA